MPNCHFISFSEDFKTSGDKEIHSEYVVVWAIERHTDLTFTRAYIQTFLTFPYICVYSHKHTLKHCVIK